MSYRPLGVQVSGEGFHGSRRAKAYANLIYVYTGLDSFHPWGYKYSLRGRLVGRDGWADSLKVSGEDVVALGQVLMRLHHAFADDRKVRERADFLANAAGEEPVKNEVRQILGGAGR